LGSPQGTWYYQLDRYLQNFEHQLNGPGQKSCGVNSDGVPITSC
jgi:hypothetical protein